MGQIICFRMKRIFGTTMKNLLLNRLQLMFHFGIVGGMVRLSDGTQATVSEQPSWCYGRTNRIVSFSSTGLF
jgi:hypothetical protein